VRETQVLTDLTLPFVAIESTREHTTSRAVFSRAKIINIVEGEVVLDTNAGPRTLIPGEAAAIGTGHWCSLIPNRPTRIWTLYYDEERA